jgi:hypothetical protein
MSSGLFRSRKTCTVKYTAVKFMIAAGTQTNGGNISWIYAVILLKRVDAGL